MFPGLARCNWAGRNQAIRKHRLTYYLDGAHTLESVQVTVVSIVTDKGVGYIDE